MQAMKTICFFFLNKCWIGLYSNSSTVIECSSCSCSEREKAYTTKHAKWWHTLEEKGRDEKRCIKEKESCKYSDIERSERIVAYMCVCVCVCVCVCIYMYIEREYIHCINIYIYILSPTNILLLFVSESVIISRHGGTTVGKHLHRSLLWGLEPPKGLHYWGLSATGF